MVPQCVCVVCVPSRGSLIRTSWEQHSSKPNPYAATASCITPKAVKAGKRIATQAPETAPGLFFVITGMYQKMRKQEKRLQTTDWPTPFCRCLKRGS